MEKTDELKLELRNHVRSDVGPIASPEKSQWADALPKTRSGKILRGTMRNIADGKQYKMPATIENPEVLGEIAAAMGLEK